jgi:hypothetical protein
VALKIYRPLFKFVHINIIGVPSFNPIRRIEPAKGQAVDDFHQGKIFCEHKGGGKIHRDDKLTKKAYNDGRKA